jgi:hypothetical protein
MDCEVTKSSGNALLDREALDILRRASPYPAFPAAKPGDRDSCEFFALTRALPRSPRYGRGWDAPAPSDEPEEVDRDEVDTSCNIGAILGLR